MCVCVCVFERERERERDYCFLEQPHHLETKVRKFVRYRAVADFQQYFASLTVLIPALLGFLLYPDVLQFGNMNPILHVISVGDPLWP